MKVLFTGGGTGGHLYPALAVADELKGLRADAEIVFIGTPDRIESRVVPESGYAFEAIPMRGLPRKSVTGLIGYMFHFSRSIYRALVKIRRIQPDVAVGSGGYVSVPPLLAAKVFGIPLILMESNSFPGLATKLLQRFADVVHLNYSEAGKYIKDKNKIRITGNPVRKSKVTETRIELRTQNRIPADKKVILILGGSLGAGSMNRRIGSVLADLLSGDKYIIWQTGQKDFENCSSYSGESIHIVPFIKNIADYYTMADIVVCRAGATTLTELSMFGLPAVLVPSPNVTDDHQTANAQSLINAGAAVMVKENAIESELVNKVNKILSDEKLYTTFKNNISALARPEAAKVVAESVIEAGQRKRGKNV